MEKAVYPSVTVRSEMVPVTLLFTWKRLMRLAPLMVTPEPMTDSGTLVLDSVSPAKDKVIVCGVAKLPEVSKRITFDVVVGTRTFLLPLAHSTPPRNVP